jgi:hypothetical protein
MEFMGNENHAVTCTVLENLQREDKSRAEGGSRAKSIDKSVLEDTK